MHAEHRHHRPRLPWRRAGALLSILSAVALAGCAYQPYRTSAESCSITAPQPDGRQGLDWEASADGLRPCADKWQVRVEKPVPFSMNFVEIDEQGLLANRAQAEDALAHAAQAEAGGAYVVVFVHGWHHNASSEDSNVKGFYDALALVSRWNPQRRVKGIYIGWRGDSLPVPGLRYLTFWERKNTSDEVGRGGLLEFLLRLERSVKQDDRQRNRLVVVGHSFGASVTFNALAHTYMQRFLDGVHSNDDKPRFHGYGDLVVLINPAIEAMRYMPLQSALDYYATPSANSMKPVLDFTHEKRPALLILSSEGDWATHKVFPGARFFSTALEAHNHVSATQSPSDNPSYNERTMDLKTVGNFNGFQTHQMLALSPGAAGADTPVTQKLTERCQSLGAGAMWRNLNQTDALGATFPDSQIQVRRLARSKALDASPYIVAPVSADIVRDHSHIGSPNLVCWINQLLDTQEEGVRTLLTAADAPE